jgi:hypothetical protein
MEPCATCSRTQNRELFRLAIGGYGLFGVVTRAASPDAAHQARTRGAGHGHRRLAKAFDQRIAEGFLYGDCQFSTDVNSDGFLKKGVFSCYRPLPPDTLMPTEVKELGEGQWRELYYLSHADTRRAYETYVAYYLSTSGQRYWSDLNQMSLYLDNYHEELDRRLQAGVKGTEMITELYVPRTALMSFLGAVRADFRQHDAQLIYGTIRLIEKDGESFLAWAREPWVCTVMNLHVDHDESGLRKAATTSGALSTVPSSSAAATTTYHRWRVDSRSKSATRKWLSSCASSGATIRARSSKAIGTAITRKCSSISFERKPPSLCHALERRPNVLARSVVCITDHSAGGRRLRRCDCSLHPAHGRNSPSPVRRGDRARRGDDHVGHSGTRCRYYRPKMHGANPTILVRIPFS